MSTDHIRPLTTLRLFPALLVFLHHYAGLGYRRADHPLQSIIIEGHIGVTIFFALSGFLLTARYYPAIASGTFNLGDYTRKRAARILPLYWILLALVFLYAPVVGYHAGTPQSLLNIALLGTYFARIGSAPIFTAWSLAVEIAFYAFAPFIFWLCWRWKPIPVLALWASGLFIAGIGLVGLSNAIGLVKPYGFMETTSFMTFGTIFGRGFDFSAGVAVGLFYLKRQQNPLKSQQALVIFISTLVAIIGCQMLMNALGGVNRAWWLNPVIALFTALICLALTSRIPVITPLMSHPLPVFMGKISYALFLLQGTPFVSQTFRLDAESPGAVIVLYGVLSVISALVYQFIEQPARRGILRMLKRDSG